MQLSLHSRHEEYCARCETVAALAIGLVVVLAYVLWPAAPSTGPNPACRTVRHIVVNEATKQAKEQMELQCPCVPGSVEFCTVLDDSQR